MTTGKTIALTRRNFVGKVVSLLSYTVCVAHNFSSRKQVSFNFMAILMICSDLGPKKIKSVTVSIVFPSICHEVMGSDSMILVFLMLTLKPAFSLSSFTFFHQEAL